MDRTLFSIPDEYSSIPFLAVLPREGDVAELSRLIPSLYARYEKALSLKRSFQETPGESIPTRVKAEEEMLRNVLEWLNVGLPSNL
jgi:hypothetical protein